MPLSPFTSVIPPSWLTEELLIGNFAEEDDTQVQLKRVEKRTQKIGTIRVRELFPKVTPPKVCRPDASLACPTLNIGLEVEVENWDGKPSVMWDNHPDDSLRNKGQEFTFGPSYGDAVVRAVTTICEEANRRKWKATARTGIHVHLDVSSLDMEFFRCLVEVYLLAEPFLYKYAGEWRRWCNFCYSTDEAEDTLLHLRSLFLDDLDNDTARHIINGADRYSGMNYQSLAKFGTVEFRMLPTTFDPDIFLTWINALMCIYKMAEEIHAGKRESIRDLVKSKGPLAAYESLFGVHPKTWEAFAPMYSEKLVRQCLPKLKLLNDGAVVGVDEWDDVGGIVTSSAVFLPKEGNPFPPDVFPLDYIQSGTMSFNAAATAKFKYIPKRSNT